ncbi:MAG TPA: hypothetical protein DE314_17280 [Sulfitobacter sp.]|nr:hypothetical protein [Sulfitobacter sp.]
MYLIDIFLPVLIGPHMKHKFFITMMLMFGFVGPAMSDTVSSAQRMLNQLGYNAGPVDGSYGGKTRTALEKFYADNGSSYDGKLDVSEVADLRSSISARGLNSIAKIAVTDQHRFDNFPGIVNFQMSDAMRKSWFGYTWLTAFDTTDDGKDDLIFYADSPFANVKGNSPNETGNLVVAPYIEKWKDWDWFEGIESPKTTLNAPFQKYADMNGDGRLDMVVASSWVGANDMNGGAYVLFNLGNGTFKSKRVSSNGFTHAMGVGDLDNDGDQDIIYHHFSSKNIVCEMNNGRGKFKRVNCLKSPRVKNSNEAKHSRGVQPVWGFRVADFDNDGSTDVAVFAQIGDKSVARWSDGMRDNQMKNPTIFWGDSSGKFKWDDITELNMEKWSTAAKAKGDYYFQDTYAGATVDFQNDGDVDIVAIAIGGHFVGGAIVAFENQGNREFSAKEIFRTKYTKDDSKRFRKMQDSLDKIRNHPDYTWISEGIVWNQTCGNPMFKDLNGDGNLDFFCGGSVREMSNSEVTDRWENHQKANQRYAPLQNPSDWDPSWSTNHVYSILDKDLNVIDAGKVLDPSFKVKGYKMDLIGF